jgi:SAM-dependent methyltransferase
MGNEGKLYLNSSFTFLRLFDRGIFGFTLIISKTGTLIHALNQDGSRVLQFFREEGASLSAVQRQLEKAHMLSLEELECFLDQLIAKKILQYKKPKTLATWIDPSDVSTLLTKDAEIFSITFSKYLSRLFTENTSIIDSFKEFLPRLKKFFPTTSNSNRFIALDIGCGSGYYSEVLKGKTSTVISIDLSFERLLSFQNRSQKEENTRRLAIVSNALSLPFKENYIDLILCVFVLEHVLDPFKVIEEMGRIAKPGAKFIIAFPSYSMTDTIGTLLKRSVPFLTFGHFHDFGLLSSRIPWCRNMAALIKKLRCANIQIEHMQGISLFGLRPNNFFVRKLSNLMDKTIGKMFPFNRFGAQTIIIGRKE